MTHDELQISLGAYALDALDPDEAELVERHIEDCPRCRAEVTAHLETAALLGNFGAQAPDGLWSRIAAEIAGQSADDLDLDITGAAPAPPILRALPSQAAAQAPTTAAADDPGAGPATAPAPTPIASRRSRRWQISAALVAAAAVVVGFLAVSVNRLDDRVQRMQAAVSSTGSELAAAAVALDPAHKTIPLRAADGTVAAEVVVSPDGQSYVISSSLAVLPSGRTYQLWGLAGGRVVSLGLLGPAPRLASFRIDGAVSQLMVTAEPSGGVVAPDTPVLVKGEVPSA